MKKVFVAQYLYDEAGEEPEFGVIDVFVDRPTADIAVKAFKDNFAAERDLTYCEDSNTYELDGEEVTFIVNIEERVLR